MDTKEPVTRGPDRPFEPDHWDLGKVQTMPWNVERQAPAAKRGQLHRIAASLVAMAALILLLAASFILGMEFGR